MTEETLRAQVIRSEEAGFRLLFQQYQGYVYSIVWSRIKGVCTKEDAEECVSDVFAEVFLHFHEIRQGALQAYIGTVAKRTAIDCFRSRTAKKNAVLPDDTLADKAAPDDVAAEYEQDEQNRQLLASIRSLGEPDASIIIQKYYYDRDAKEIAAAVHMTPVAVRVRLSRALKRLKTLLTDDGFSL